MPKRVVFSWGEQTPEASERAERQRRAWLEAGLCGDCGHDRHEPFHCRERVVRSIFRQCFGTNPHTRVEDGPCLCAARPDGTNLLDETMARARKDEDGQ